MSQFTGGFDQPHHYDMCDLEIVNLHERPDLAYGIHEVISRNLDSLRVPGVFTADYYHQQEDFLVDVALSLDGSTNVTSGNHVDLNALLMGDRVVGCIEVATMTGESCHMYTDIPLEEVEDIDDELFEGIRILHGYIDAEGGYSNRGIMTKAAGLIIERLFSVPDIDTLLAIAHSSNKTAIHLIEKIGFSEVESPKYLKNKGIKKFQLENLQN
jgi:ribosomal protein S18 acetylase RimI-like enzyme